MKNFAALAAVWLLINPSFLAQSPAESDSKTVFDRARQIAGVSKGRIWPGFDPFRYASLKSEDGKRYIRFTPEPDNPNSPIFFTLFDEYFKNHDLNENLSITFHEAFHAFQRDKQRNGRPWRAEKPMLLFEYKETSARNNALFSIEAKILRAAVQTRNKAELKRRAQEFLTIRRLRQSELDARFVEFEKDAELNEGLAEYAGTMAVVAGMQAVRQKRISVPFLETRPETYLLKKYEKLDSITKIGRNVRLKFYYTGSAQGLLLDRLMPDWKMKVQFEGKTLQDLLASSLEKLRQIEPEVALDRYDYKRILAEEEKASLLRKADNQALLEKTLNQKGRKYTIDYSAMGKTIGIRSFDPMNVTMVSPKIRVHTRSVKFAGDGSFTAAFSQPVVEDLENKRYTTVLPENVKETVTADGAVIDLTKPGQLVFRNKLSIDSPGFSLEAAAGTIEIRDQSVTIRATNIM